MRKNSVVRNWLVLIIFCGLIMPALHAQTTSTPEERIQWGTITHRLEVSPLDDSANKDGEWALKRVMDAKDFHVSLCMNLFGEFRNLDYPYQHNILRQYMLASAAFQIENPSNADDLTAMNVFAVESVLKSYSAILLVKPDAKSKVLDGLLKKQKEGKLEDTIHKECK